MGMKTRRDTTEAHKQDSRLRTGTLGIVDLLKEDMLLLRTFAPWLLLAFIGRQVSLSSGARHKNREADKAVTPAPGRAQRSGDKAAANGRGKFSIDEEMQCTWGAQDVADAVRLTVKCENRQARIKGGVTDLQCEYNGKPQRCPGYQSDPKGFWKQVGRAFKRLRSKACRDELALVKATMCKRAPRDAHFKLDIFSSVASAQSGEPQTAQPVQPRASSTTADPAQPTACTRRVDHQKKAEEHCSSSWVSLCSFFFSLLQNDDC